MNTKILRLVLMLSLLLVPFIGSAYDIRVDGIYYYVNVENKTVTVTHGAQEYKGEIIIPSSISYGNHELSVTQIGYEAFYGCSSLTSVEISNSVTEIGTEAFSGCSGLTSVTIGNSVTSIGNSAFSSCSSLTTVTIPNSVTEIGHYAFRYCYGLKSVVIGNSVTSMGDSAFYGCDNLIKSAYPDNLTYPFPSGTMIRYPADNVIIEDGFIFSSDRKELYFVPINLTGHYSIPDSVTSIGNNAFRGCSGLTSVTIPNSVTSIGDYAFSGCSGLTRVTIPNSVTSIGDYAFYSCSLTDLYIGEKVRNIYSYAFYGGNLKKITIGAIIPPDADKDIFDTMTYLSATLYVPEESINSYKEVTPWSNFSIVGLGEFPEVEVSSVTLNAESVELVEGQTFQLTAEVMPLDAPDRTVTWSSSNESVALVSQSGLVVALSSGEAVITATCGGKSAVCKVKVVTSDAGVHGVIDDLESFAIYTVSGVLVKQNATAESLDGLPSGIYILKDASGKTRRIIK